MPRKAVPAYLLHQSTGLARVRLDGRDVYLGKYGTPASRAEYDRVIAEWLAGGRHLTPRRGPLTVAQLVEAYHAHAAEYYQRDGRPTSEVGMIRNASRHLEALYGDTLAGEFGPLSLKGVRERMVQSGLARKTVNAYVDRIRRCFRWAAENELVPATVHQALRTVAGLARGRTEAPERDPVAPVDVGLYEATLPHLLPRTADILRVVRLTGCRPGEACALRGDEIDTAGEVWACRPGHHKTAHRGKTKVFGIGPAAQAVLAPYLVKAAGGWLFPGAKGHLLEVTVQAQLRAACRAAGLPHWRASQLRHLRATEIRARYGAEAAQDVLGHEQLSTTQIYAERSLGNVARILKDIG